MSELYVPSVDEEERKAIGAKLDEAVADQAIAAIDLQRELVRLRQILFSSAQPATAARIKQLESEVSNSEKIFWQERECHKQALDRALAAEREFAKLKAEIEMRRQLESLA
jgi:hypothetical protein